MPYQHNQLTFATIVKSIPYDDREPDITICSLHTDTKYWWASYPAAYTSERVHLCGVTWILTRQCRYSVASGGCPKHDDVLPTDGGAYYELKSV